MRALFVGVVCAFLALHVQTRSVEDDLPRQKAAFVMLLKGDLESVLIASQALRSIDWAFNKNAKYPLVLFHSGIEEQHHDILRSNFSGSCFHTFD